MCRSNAVLKRYLSQAGPSAVWFEHRGADTSDCGDRIMLQRALRIGVTVCARHRRLLANCLAPIRRRSVRLRAKPQAETFGSAALPAVPDTPGIGGGSSLSDIPGGQNGLIAVPVVSESRRGEGINARLTTRV